MGDKDSGDKVQDDKTTIGRISIGGNVGTIQSVTVTGGTISGPIIGNQTNYYGSLPPPISESPTDVSQENIDQQRELLEAHRRTLAVYLRRLAKQSEAHAPPEIFHGIREARTGIQYVKATLRGWGVVIADHPDDAGNV